MIAFLKRSLLLFTTAALVLLAASANVHAAYNTSTFNVTVNISSVGQIVVDPISLAWNQLNPGSDGAFQNITVKNVGSLNVTNLSISSNTITLEASNPLNSGNPASYAAPGFLLVQNESSGAPYFHLGRLEWNLTSTLGSEVLPASIEPKWAHGWYRNASGNEYLWLLQNGSNGQCNTTGTKFQIKTAPENSSAMKRDLSDAQNTNTACGGSLTAATGGQNWGTFTCSGATNPLNLQFVATYYDCSRIYIFNYDKVTTTIPTTAVPYAWNSIIVPGTMTYFNFKASIPYGMPAGDTTQGTVTFTAYY